MDEKIEKTEARQGVCKRWQEHALWISLFAAIAIAGGGLMIFFATT